MKITPQNVFNNSQIKLHSDCVGNKQKGFSHLNTLQTDVFTRTNPSFGNNVMKLTNLAKPAVEDILEKKHATQIYRNNILRIAKFGVPCPCCGQIMLDSESFNKFNQSLLNAKTPKKILACLHPYKEYLHPTERKIFEMLAKYNSFLPNASLHSILLSCVDTAEEHLVKEQAKIFTQIGFLGRKLAPEDCEKLNKLLLVTYKQLFDKEPTSVFSRKIFIAKIDDITQNAEPELKNKMMENAINLPTSYNNVNAFIVKYAKKDYKKQNPDKVIAIRLLSNSIATIEHIKPQKCNGTNTPENLAIECARDNNARNHDSLPGQIKNNPQMPQNYQKFMKRLAQLVEEGLLEKEYVVGINNSFSSLSDGILYRDLTGLRFNSKPAKEVKQKNSTEEKQPIKKLHKHIRKEKTNFQESKTKCIKRDNRKRS